MREVQGVGRNPAGTKELGPTKHPPISSFTGRRPEGLNEGGRGPGTNLALKQLPAPPPRRGRSDGCERASRGLCARLKSSCRRPAEPPAPGGRTFPGRPPPGSRREPLRPQNPELLLPAPWPSCPSSPPKCRSTSPGTGRCWPTRISRSTCAPSVSSCPPRSARAARASRSRTSGGLSGALPSPRPACRRWGQPSCAGQRKGLGCQGSEGGQQAANWEGGCC